MLHYCVRDKRMLYEGEFAYTVRQFIASFETSLTKAPAFAETLRAFIDGRHERAFPSVKMRRCAGSQSATSTSSSA